MDMITTIGLEFGTHNLSEPDGSNGWHLVNLTLGEVETIRRALHPQDTVHSRALAVAIDKEMSDDPRTIDMHHFIGIHTDDL